MTKETTADLAKRSLALFGIAGSLRRVATGLDTTYRVKASDGRVFALRISSRLPIRRVSAFCVEAQWIEALFDNPWFDVPQVQRTEAGSRVAQVQDTNGTQRASTLLAWIPGRRRYYIGTAQARALGQMAGALHQHAQAHPAPLADAIKSWDGRFMCGMGKKEEVDHFGPAAAELIQRTCHTVQRVMARIDPSEIGLINADLGLHNVLWHQGRAGLVDFNDAGTGPYAFCLGRLLDRIRAHKNGQALADELLSAYRQVTPVPAAYREWGGLFEVAAAVFGLNFSATRVVSRGIALEQREVHLISALNKKLDRLRL
jgi:Ser/Thr protein kinase RdoA (MazF antagonist)